VILDSTLYFVKRAWSLSRYFTVLPS